MLGIIRQRVACKGNQAWSLHRGVQLVASGTFASSAKEMTVRDALNSTLDEEMSADPKVFLMGAEVGEYQGAYKISNGLHAKYGPERVVDTPIYRGVLGWIFWNWSWCSILWSEACN